MSKKTPIDEVLKLSTSGHVTDWNDHFWSDLEDAEEYMYQEYIDSMDIYPCKDEYLIVNKNRLIRQIEDAVSSGVDLTSDEYLEKFLKELRNDT